MKNYKLTKQRVAMKKIFRFCHLAAIGYLSGVKTVG